MADPPAIFRTIAQGVRRELFRHELNQGKKGRVLRETSDMPIIAAFVTLASRNVTHGAAEVILFPGRKSPRSCPGKGSLLTPYSTNTSGGASGCFLRCWVRGNGFP